jgi:hypothetical protein
MVWTCATHEGEQIPLKGSKMKIGLRSTIIEENIRENIKITVFWDVTTSSLVDRHHVSE